MLRITLLKTVAVQEFLKALRGELNAVSKFRIRVYSLNMLHRGLPFSRLYSVRGAALGLLTWLRTSFFILMMLSRQEFVR